ncbi:hypothetical protein RUND412_005392 [Rhizina undulata]
MAPITISSNTDTLDDALKNKTLLPSWKSIFARLTSPSAPSAETIASISEYLASPASIDTLSNCHNPFPPPSAASKTDFEKRTAPINITAADQPAGSSGGGDESASGSVLPEIKVVKDEALELSKNLNIDEVSALRIVVLEYQNRPATALLNSEAGAGGGGAAEGKIGIGNFSESILKRSVQVSDEEKKETLFLDRAKIYLGERRYVIKTATFLIRNALVGGRHRKAWSESATNFVAEVLEKGGLAEKVIGAFMSRWKEGDKNGEGLPEWVKSRLNGEASFLWEKELRYFEYFDIKRNYYYILPLAAIVSLTMLQIYRVERYLRDEAEKAASAESSATPPAIDNRFGSMKIPNSSDKKFYIQDPAAMKAITECFRETCKFPEAALSGFCWAAIVETILGFVRENTPEHDDLEFRRYDIVEFYDNIVHDLVSIQETRSLAAATAKNALEYINQLVEPGMAGSAFNGSQFWVGAEEDGMRMKNVLASLVREGTIYLEFGSELLAAYLLVTEVDYRELGEARAFLEEERGIGEDFNEPSGWVGSAAKRAWNDPKLRTLLSRAKHRFPYEPLPLLKLMRGLVSEAAVAVEYLTKMDTYTQTVPPDFREYDDVDVDADISRIRLVSDLVLFAPRDGGIFERNGGGGGIVVPEGTIGAVVSSGGGVPVVVWQYAYNALTLFGRVLECALIGDGGVTGEISNEDAVMEIVGLLTMLTASGTADPNSNFDPRVVLEDASDMVGRNRDIVSIIFDLLEEALQVAQNAPSSAKPTEFIVTALHFVDALIPVLPGRVWPYLARSTLLERNGRGGAFVGIVSSVEVVRGNYDFTLACIRLYDDLVDEAIKSAVLNMGGSRNAQAAGRAPGTGVSVAVQRDILAGWTRVMVNVFESYRGWKYANKRQQMDIGKTIATIFTKILESVYGVDDSIDLNSKVTSVLTPSAEHLIKAFLSKDANELPVEPILGAIVDGIATPETTLFTHSLESWIQHVVAVLKFSEICLRVRGYLNLPSSQMEQHLYTSSSSLAKLYAIHDRFRQPVLELLEILVIASGSTNEGEPPSLLGHLGTDCASHLAVLLVNQDKPFDDLVLETRIWGFVSAVVSNKQQGMSILLLCGETLWNGGMKGKDKKVKSKSILSAALDALSDIDKLPSARALAMLETVTLAQNFWSLAMEDLGRHPTFLPGITKHVENLNVEFLPADSKAIITEKSNKVVVAAHIAQILAMHLHSRRPSARDQTFFAKLIPKLRFYYEKAVKISGYRASLHIHLQKNFEEKWSGLGLMKFKKTRIRRMEYGPNYVYDMGLIGKVLSFDPSWDGRSDGYSSEVQQANLNLSLVDSQVVLMRAWRLLAMELCDFVAANKDLEKPLVEVIENCLQANIETGLPPPIFTTIVCERAEFAFVIMRRLQQSLPSVDSLFDGILGLAWKAIQSSSSNFRRALATADARHYRSLLRILYIALNANVTKPKHSVETTYMILDILNLVVTKGFKDLATAAHNHPDRANPEDIALVTAILQAALKLKGMETIHGGLSMHIADNGTIRAATTLYSWAEQLAVGDDPVYGELSTLFLLELSSVPIIAEQLAVEGILELLVSSSLSGKIRQGVSPTSDPRLHAVWSRGLLPIALNLLAHIGPRIGREVAAFLTYFSNQIESCVESWKKPNVVTLSTVNEATTLVMLMEILGKLSVPVTGVKFDKAVLTEGVDYLLSHRNYLATLVVPTSVEEDAALRREGEGGNELVTKVIAGMVLLQGLLGDDEMEE